MKLLIVDNYDSFTYNIVHLIKELGVTPEVYRNDRIEPEEIDRYDKIILSPGPGIPCEAGILNKLIRRYAARKSILGICLGEQAIGECFGAGLKNLPEVYHGVATPIRIVKRDVLFEGIGENFEAGRYHSWVVDRINFPDCLQITAVDEKGEIMALAHREYDVKGVQFHPESILTPQGKKIIENWLGCSGSYETKVKKKRG